MRELIGVYDADAGVRGEAAYLVGRLLGRRHCGLCDVTHSPVRRKPAWDALVRDLAVPFRLAHLNQLRPDERRVVGDTGAPVVLERRADGSLEVLMDRGAIESVGGDVGRFGVALRHELAEADRRPDQSDAQPPTIGPF